MRDLTAKQRQREADLVSEAARKKLGKKSGRIRAELSV